MNNREAHFYLEELQRMMTQHRGIFSEEFICANGMAILALEQNRKDGRWIPCSERLPEDVLCGTLVTDGMNVWVETWIGIVGKWKYNHSEITAWMPLPEPYEERSEDNG